MVKIYCENIHRPKNFVLIEHDQLQKVQNVYGLILNFNKLLLIQLAGSNLHFFPGGKIEYGESHSEALKREVYEETNQSIVACTMQEFLVQNAYIYHPLKRQAFHCESTYYSVNIENTLRPLGQSAEGEACWIDLSVVSKSTFSPNGYKILQKYFEVSNAR